jgi:hypothetical protein
MLPEGYQGLERFVAKWAKPTMVERARLRFDSTAEERAEFSKIVLPFADGALTFLNGFPLEQLPDDALRLFQLMLSFAQMMPAVEVQGETAEAVLTPHNRMNIISKPLDGF